MKRKMLCKEISSHNTPCPKPLGHKGQHECHYGPGCCWPIQSKPSVRNGFVYYPALVQLTINTHTPGKWLLVDRETGECWIQKNGSWGRA